MRLVGLGDDPAVLHRLAQLAEEPAAAARGDDQGGVLAVLDGQGPLQLGVGMAAEVIGVNYFSR
ncbi:MAG: hypothetical protein H7338_15990 [Candidatus Sericytochromatia bacterium]|nr:hypothetical protein [Candidatus Sericytochromatia bacterium]